MSEKSVLGERFEIGDLLGQGGMGTVYHGTDTANHQPVAIKRLKPELVAADPGTVERFAREGEALRALNHPNIVKVLATLQADGQHYIVMEYVDGGSLYDLLQPQPQLPVNRTLAIALELADALTRAHYLKIIHRDIKPANVLIAGDDTARLTDFGVAQIGGEKRLTQTGAAVGTPDYLSPEALNGEVVDSRSDIWAFGVMLFEMLAGKRPFHADNLTGVLGAILTKPVPDLEALRPDAPVALIDLIYRMLDKDRNQRIPSVRQVGAELENILQGRAATATASRPVAPSAFATPTPSTDAEDQPHHNLPVQTTPFVGRESELAELAKLLTNPHIHLVTILAPGGMGKTRLALATAQTLLDAGNSPPYRYAEGSGVGFISPSPLAGRGSGGGVKNVYFVPLAPLTSPDFIVSTIADAVGFQFYPGGEPKQQLLDYFREKSMLLVIDNFEHLLDGAGIVSDILNYALGIKVLATSRERLNLSGETLFALSGMDFPEWETPEDALNYAAVKLFMQSARRARADFELTGDDLTYLARICRLVAGMPLGIVLAAAWVEMLSLKEIAKEIESSLDFLETELRDVPERQRSIRGVFEYSWNRLSDDERSAFKKLSVFRGGFTREAAQVVANASLKVLTTLVNKSLLRRDPNTGRYEVHELLRQYGEQQLTASGEVDAARHTHSAYFADFLHQREPDLKGRRQLPTLNEVEAEFENVRAAWSWAVVQKDAALLDQSLESLFLFCEMRSRSLEGKELFWQAQAQFASDEPPPVWGRLLTRWAQLWLLQEADSEANAAVILQIEKSRALAQKRGERTDIAYCWWTFGLLLSTVLDYDESVTPLETSLALYTVLEDRFYMARTADMLAWTYLNLGQRDKADECNWQSLDLRRQIGDQFGVALTLQNIAVFTLNDGQYAESERYFREIGSIHLEMGNRVWLARNTANLAWLAFCRGDFEEARALADEALAVLSEAISGGKWQAIALLGMLANMEEDFWRARQLCETAIGYDFLYLAHPGLAIALCGLGDYALAREQLRSSLKGLVTRHFVNIMAMGLPIAALIRAHEGDQHRAVELLALAFTHPASATGWLEKWPQLTRLRAQLQADLGDAAFTAAWERGEARDLEATVSELLADTD